MRVRLRAWTRRWTMAVLLALACVAASGLDARGAQPPPAARDEFVPVNELPPQDRMPAAPLVIGAYGVAWLIIALYIFSVWRRLDRVERELQALTGRLASTGSAPRAR
jgi:CcmD family protein